MSLARNACLVALEARDCAAKPPGPRSPSPDSSDRRGHLLAGARRAAIATSSRSGQHLGRLRPGDRMLSIHDEHRHAADADALCVLVSGLDLARQAIACEELDDLVRVEPRLFGDRCEHLGAADVATLLEQGAKQGPDHGVGLAMLLGEQDQAVGDAGCSACAACARTRTPRRRPGRFPRCAGRPRWRRRRTCGARRRRGPCPRAAAAGSGRTAASARGPAKSGRIARARSSRTRPRKHQGHARSATKSISIGASLRRRSLMVSAPRVRIAAKD